MSESPDAEEARSINATIRSYGFLETENIEESDGALNGWQHDARTIERSRAFIDRHDRNDRPWFLAVNLVNPHDIMYYTSGDEMTRSRVSPFPDRSVRPPFEDPLYAEHLGYDLFENYGPRTFGTRPAAVTEYHLTISEAMGHLDYTDLDIGREMQNYYWNCTRDSDRHLKVLLDHLRSTGALDSTIIVFTSDHGELLGAHGMRGKGTFAARESARTPAIVVHPGGRRGVECDAISTHVDLAPTLLGLAGVRRAEVREQMPMLIGQDLSGLVFDASAPWSRDAVLLHWTAILYQDHRNVRRFDEVRRLDPDERLPAIVAMMETGLRRRGQMRGAYDGRWKLSRYSGPHNISQPQSFAELIASHDIELYDTHTDPGETTNLAVDPYAVQSEIERLNALINQLVADEVGIDDGSFALTFGISFQKQ